MSAALDRLSELERAATPGPWRPRRAGWERHAGDWEHPEVWGVAAGAETWHTNKGSFHPDEAQYVENEHEVVSIGYDRDYYTAEAAIGKEADAALIVEARNALPALLAVAKAAEELEAADHTDALYWDALRDALAVLEGRES